MDLEETLQRTERLQEPSNKNYNVSEENFTSFSQNDIERLQKIHFETTGEHINNQDAIEMGIRIVELLRIVYKPIPEL